MEVFASSDFCSLFYITGYIYIMYGSIQNALDIVNIFSPLFPSTVGKLVNKSSHIFDLVSYLKPTMGKNIHFAIIRSGNTL